jgi:hypothetical protein
VGLRGAEEPGGGSIRQPAWRRRISSGTAGGASSEPRGIKQGSDTAVAPQSSKDEATMQAAPLCARHCPALRPHGLGWTTTGPMQTAQPS